MELGTFRLTDAYEQAIRYPFRAGSAKAVVGVLVSPCEKSPFLLSVILNFTTTYYKITYKIKSSKNLKVDLKYAKFEVLKLKSLHWNIFYNVLVATAEVVNRTENVPRFGSDLLPHV